MVRGLVRLWAPLGLAAVLYCTGSAPSFLGSSQGLRLRSAGRHVADGIPSPGGCARFSQDMASFYWLPALGVALAGASLSSRRSHERRLTSRLTVWCSKEGAAGEAEAKDKEETEDAEESDEEDDNEEGFVSKRRNSLQYGLGKEPKMPDWVKKAGTPGAHPNTPKWLTASKWKTMNNNERFRSMNYLKQRYDDEGNDLTKIDWTMAKVVDQIFTNSTRVDNPGYGGKPIRLQMCFNLDLKQPDEQIRMQVKLPHATGRERKVAVFCSPAEEEEVMKLGAYKAGRTLEDAIRDEDIDFDVLITKPAMMPAVAKLGRILGPRKLTPSPKAGTVVQDFEEAIENFKYERAVEIKPDAECKCAAVLGKVTLGRDKLFENLRSITQQIADNAPKGCQKKETFWQWMGVNHGQGPSFRISPSEFPAHPRTTAEDEAEESGRVQVMTKRTFWG